MRAFVSYSRAQFYFAEDLALALRQRGIDAWIDLHILQPGDDWEGGIEAALRASQTFVLVASREAFASPHVQAELRLALELQLPVVVAVAEPVDLPRSLDGAPSFDLRRGFEHKVGAVVAALNGHCVSATSGGQAAVVRVLMVVLLGWAMVSSSISVLVLTLSMAGRQQLSASWWVLISLLCLWLAWEIAHRKPKRFVALFVMLVYGALLGAAACALALILLLLGAPDLIFLLLGAAMIPLPIWVARSPAFYRWCPTGSAPRWMRSRMLARRGHRSGVVPRDARVISYTLHSSAPDDSVRRALDAGLRARNHRPVEDGSEDRQICIVSDLTPLAWLQDTLAQLSGHVVLVISGPVSLDALHNVERYHWVDHRRRRRRTLLNLASTIGSSPGAGAELIVPESLGARVVPLPVFLICVCYVGAAVSAFATGVSTLVGADMAAMYGTPPTPPVTVAAVTVACALPAYTTAALATRRVSLRRFLALYAGTITALVGFQRLMYPAASIWVSVAPVVLIGAAYLAAAFRTLTGWLPRDGVDRSVPRLAPGQASWWRRPVARRVLVAALAAIAVYIVVGTSIS